MIRTIRLFVITLALAALLRPGLSAQAPPPPPCEPSPGVQFVCGLQAPEDLVVLPGSQWVVAGAYGGSGGLYLIRASDRTTTRVYPAAGARERHDTKIYGVCPGPPDAATRAKFLTHGLSLVPGATGVLRLFVVLHGGRESVEVFEVDARPATPVLTWIGCAVAPEPIGLNSVRGLPDGGFIATNFLARGAGGGLGGPSMKVMMSGERNGELWEWHTASGWQKLPGTEAAGANGIEMSEDGRTLYVAAWGSQSFFRVSRGATPVTREEVPLGFRVDNIRWARDGSILATGQGGAQGAQASIVVAIDPRTLAVRELLRHPDTPGFGAGTVTIEVGDTWWIGSFRGDRLAIVPAPRR
jgi:hypothetical protein